MVTGIPILKRWQDVKPDRISIEKTKYILAMVRIVFPSKLHTAK